MLALTVVFGLFKTAEYGSWISITIFANGRGGVSEAAAVLVAQLVPATATAIWVGSLQSWIGPRRLLIGGLLAQAAGLIATASAIEFSAGGPVVYVAAVVAASAMVTTRPAISALLPAFAETPRTLTRAHVFLGWFDSAAGIVGPLTTAACLLTANAAFSLAVFAGMSGLGAVIAASASPRIETVGTDEPESPPLRYLAVVQKILRSPGSRGPLLLLAAQALAVGCLDLLIVVVASHVGAGTSGAGWFGSALGLGAVIGSTGCIALIGRRLLWRWVVGATVVGGIAIAGLCIAFVPATAAVVFAGIALAGAVVSATGRALLQRLGEPSLIGQLFAFAEASDSAMLLLGALVVPALIALGGLDVTYVALAVLTLIVAAVVARSLAVSESRIVDTSSRVLEFRRVEPFRHLRLVALEALARSSHLHHYKAGELLITQGEPGDDFHVVVTGRVSVIRDGVTISVLDAPVGVGELALLYGIPRTATVSAVDDVETISVDRETFLLALDHQPPTAAWQALVEARLGE
jgi:Cyclic nucleotide-binding domain